MPVYQRPPNAIDLFNLASPRASLNARDRKVRRLAKKAIRGIRNYDCLMPSIYVRDGMLVRIVSINGAPVVQPLTIDRLVAMMAARIDFYGKVRGVRKPAMPPRELAAFILAMEDPPFPVLKGIRTFPFFTPTGNVFGRNGYDSATGIRCYFAPGLLDGIRAEGSRPKPTKGDVRRALDALSELLCDFDFVDDSDYAHAIAMFLTPFVLLMVKGPKPLFLINKHTPGSGGTLLAQLVAIVLGVVATRVNESKSNDELERRILSALAGHPLIALIDNITLPLESGSLASALTDVIYEGRRVKASENMRVRIDCVWIANGNNVMVSPDFSRRILPIRIDPGVERPELRTDFRHPHLEEWTRQNRAKIVWACITIVRNWVAAGMPRAKVAFGKFQDWAEILGGILEAASIPGFLSNLDEFREVADSEKPLREFIRLWRADQALAGRKCTTKELRRLALEADLDLGPDGDDHGQKVALGQMLRKVAGRVIEGFRIVAGGPRSGSQTWMLEDAKG